jgi:ubiquinone/menaquinone biosynthesis C-methylase UbiE
MAIFMVTWSRSVKVRRRERLLDYIPWRGDESVLDVGCGRGLLLVAAARRVPRGEAVGIDIWRGEDQNDNRPDAALENARLEGVAERVKVETADMRALPYADGTFDAVVSHWAVHNLPAAADRAAAVREMIRVLKPGGVVLLADLDCQREYLRLLAELGMVEVREVEAGVESRLAWVVSGGSFRPTAVIGYKPATGSANRGLSS